MRLMTLIKLVKLFVLWSESDPLLRQYGDVFYLNPFILCQILQKKGKYYLSEISVIKDL
jgi:hypothetical protein